MKKLLLLVFSFFVTLNLLAQERMISGKVTSADDGLPLPGVNVVLKGTTNGAVTDGDGNYQISVAASGGTLVFSFIGFKSSEVEIGNQSVIDFKMEQDVQQLSEVVVSALGVAREVKSLPYAAQQINSDRLNMTRANNVNDALAGKVAGIQVRGQAGGALGRNSSIRIRGAGSLTDKAPLYIINGTPVTDAIDLNPDDVESINVLKGPAATAIYGQRGDAGVIIVTLKKGTKGKGLGVNVSNNTFFDNVYIMPKYQNSYAGGAFPDLAKFTWQTGMPDEWKPLDGKYYHDYTDDSSWGPRMVGQEYIPWYAWIPGTKYTGKTASLVGQPNNVRDFYNTGVNSVTNVSLSGATDNASVRLSYTNQNQKGIIPNSSLAKNTVSLSTSTNLGKLITFGANINYVNTVVKGEFNDQYANQSSGSFNQWFHRDLDMNILKELSETKSPEGRLVSWNHFNPNDYLSLGDKWYRGFYWFNPVSYFNNIDKRNTRDRLYGDVNITFNILKNLKASVFYRKNQSNVLIENKQFSILPYSFYVDLRPPSNAQQDGWGTSQEYQKEDNLEFMINYNTKLGNDISMDVLGGGNIRYENRGFVAMNTLDGLVVPDLYTIGNSVRANFGYGNARAKKQVRSLYARGNFGFRDIVYLDWSVRNDWSSALPKNKNSYIYPSVGTSFVFSELTESALPFLSFGKIRGSWAQVGSDLDPYSTQLTYALGNNPWNSSVLSAVPNVLPDPNIKPSLSSATEFGLDTKFMQNRIGFSATYFDEKKTNEILTVNVSGASGYTNKVINAGQIHRKVVELSLDATPINTSNLTWNVTLNWSRINADVVSLSPGVDAIPAGNTVPPGVNQAAAGFGATFGVGTVYHVAGEKWGQLKGYGYKTDDNGNRIIGADGLYVRTDNTVNLGSVLPDFTGGLINNVRYKDFTLAMNIDFQKGGKFYSLSDQWGTYSGLTEKTAGVNDKGVPVRTPVAEGGGVHVTGVDESGTPVDTYVNAFDYFHQFYSNQIAPYSTFDLTYVKLRELSIGYSIPVNKLGFIGKAFTSASVSVVGRNLWLMYTNVKEGYDPSEISGQFGENGQFPSLRSYGFNIKFGF